MRRARSFFLFTGRYRNVMEKEGENPRDISFFAEAVNCGGAPPGSHLALTAVTRARRQRPRPREKTALPVQSTATDYDGTGPLPDSAPPRTPHGRVRVAGTLAI